MQSLVAQSRLEVARAAGRGAPRAEPTAVQGEMVAMRLILVGRPDTSILVRETSTTPPSDRMRLRDWKRLCPYAKWTCTNGREVLINFACWPILERYPGRPAEAADPDGSIRAV